MEIAIGSILGLIIGLFIGYVKGMVDGAVIGHYKEMPTGLALEQCTELSPELRSEMDKRVAGRVG